MFNQVEIKVAVISVGFRLEEPPTALPQKDQSVYTVSISVTALKIGKCFCSESFRARRILPQWPPGRRWQIYVVLPPSQPPGRSGLCPRNDHLPAQISALATGVARSLRVHCYLGFQGNSLRLFPVWMGQVGYKAIQHPVMDGHDLQVKVSRTLVSSQA